MKKENKTQPNSENINKLIGTLPAEQAKDSLRLIKIMSDVSGCPPVMWGARIVGFDKYHYKYASGREGDWMKIGFAPGKGRISLYITCDVSDLKNELQTLGKYKTGKGCIYINKLSDVNLEELVRLIEVAYSSTNLYAS